MPTSRVSTPCSASAASSVRPVCSTRRRSTSWVPLLCNRFAGGSFQLDRPRGAVISSSSSASGSGSVRSIAVGFGLGLGFRLGRAFGLLVEQRRLAPDDQLRLAVGVTVVEGEQPVEHAAQGRTRRSQGPADAAGGVGDRDLGEHDEADQSDRDQHQHGTTGGAECGQRLPDGRADHASGRFEIGHRTVDGRRSPTKVEQTGAGEGDDHGADDEMGRTPGFVGAVVVGPLLTEQRQTESEQCERQEPAAHADDRAGGGVDGATGGTGQIGVDPQAAEDGDGDEHEAPHVGAALGDGLGRRRGQGAVRCGLAPGLSGLAAVLLLGLRRSRAIAPFLAGVPVPATLCVRASRHSGQASSRAPQNRGVVRAAH